MRRQRACTLEPPGKCGALNDDTDDEDDDGDAYGKYYGEEEPGNARATWPMRPVGAMYHLTMLVIQCQVYGACHGDPTTPYIKPGLVSTVLIAVA